MITQAAPPTPRQDWMGVLARAKPHRLAELFPDLPCHSLLRAAEIGAVMIQGRVGGTGQPFNLGEMTITRCALQIEGGAVGYGHVQGRDRDHARRAACLDALLQGEHAAMIVAKVLEPLRAEEQQRRSVRATKAAATRVEFFTLVRGEDQ